jgi:rhamnose transport system ATP-binding protein
MREAVMETRDPVVQLHGIGKHFGGVYAIRGIDLDVFPGEVHALLGGNGAGKSTLVKVLGGIHRPDEGTMLMHGEPVSFHSPTQSMNAGISVVHQEAAVFPDLDVAENVFVGRQPAKGLRPISWDEMYADARRLLERLGVHLDVRAKVQSLSVAERQILEIAKALSFDARVLILDEPTAALSAKEVEDFFRIVRSLRDSGVAVLFVSHRLEEIKALADRITVLRDAAVVVTSETASMTSEELIRHMVGRQLDSLYPKEEAEVGEPALAVRGLGRAGVFKDITFDVRRGEILGLCGLVGAGRSEIARVIFGIDQPDEGEVIVDGEHMIGGGRRRAASPAVAMRHGIAYVPEERHGQGLVLDWDVTSNTSLSVLQNLTRWGLVRRRRERELAARYADEFQLKCSGLSQQVRTLSGGNQQKIVLAKWLATSPKVLILDEPTKGVDIQTKAEVHRLISRLAQDGLAIVLISSELPEIRGMADRILVLHEGRVTGEYARHEADEEQLMTAATGQAKHGV